MVINAVEFSTRMLKGIKTLKRPRGNPGGRKKGLKYLDVICAFDIETTTIRPEGQEPVNFMYIWQFQIGTVCTVYGRTWDEFRTFYGKLEAFCKDRTLVVFVHNLSYEWQYIKSIFNFKAEDVFAMDSRKVLKASAGCLEFRCSYILTNMSLAAFCKKMNVEHQKLSGEEFDYDIIRYPWTPLTDKELQYCLNDVIGLTEAVTAQMQRDGDTLYTMPLTSTGYPRREMKNAMKCYSREALRAMQPDYPVYCLLKDCFRGGNTHASRFYAGSIVDSEITGDRILSSDRSSSYPDVLMNCKFPVKRWKKGEATRENLKNLIHNGYAVIFRCRFSDLRLRNENWPCPYLTEDKGRASSAEIDNGRILCASSYETALTDVDFRIVLFEYVFSDIEITELYFTEYGTLPEPMRAVIRYYYKQKSALKGADDPFQKLLYDKSKAILNGLYGLCAMDPCKPRLVWNGEAFEQADDDPEQVLAKNSRKAFINYAWGIYCTAWSRYRLEQGIAIAGPDDFIYCDTDSVKYTDHGQNWDKFNEQRKADSIASGSVAEDSCGERHYMGVFEPDGEYKRFSTLGAKRYAYEDMAGELHITISGVSKKAAAELGKLENFKEGFTFHHPGKTESDYVDKPEQKYITIEGKQIELTSYVVITETTYNLSLSDSYRNLLRLISER